MPVNCLSNIFFSLDRATLVERVVISFRFVLKIYCIYVLLFTFLVFRYIYVILVDPSWAAYGRANSNGNFVVPTFAEILNSSACLWVSDGGDVFKFAKCFQGRFYSKVSLEV